ncbi:hypothetical protein ACFVAD_17185 [Sutcliffiella sp. NPDC057660]|uniref:hypothetical protein n=1 Tax=Sutcliffiella sp. NPDC057660 TaxID=3346199 RepID=UPI0036AA8DF6
MNKRNETELFNINENVVFAKQDEYVVAVIKMKSSSENKTNLALIIPEQGRISNQKRILLKKLKGFLKQL